MLHIILKTRIQALRIYFCHLCSLNRTGAVTVWSWKCWFWVHSNEAIFATVIIFCGLEFSTYLHEITSQQRKQLYQSCPKRLVQSDKYFYLKKNEIFKIKIFRNSLTLILTLTFRSKVKFDFRILKSMYELYGVNNAWFFSKSNISPRNIDFSYFFFYVYGIPSLWIF